MRRNPIRQLKRVFEQCKLCLWHARTRDEINTSTVDVTERSEAFILTCALPGFEADGIAIRVVDHVLNLHAEREAEETAETDHYSHYERRQTDVSWTIALPGAVAERGISASFRGGVLTVTMPKERPEV